MRKLLEPRFYKMSGAGNTFVFVDARASSPLATWESGFSKERKDWVPLVCHEERGLGVDGMLFLHEGQKDSDYTWDFYNADGSGAEFCGNAARCAGLFCQEVLGAPSTQAIRFSTVAGPVRVSTTLDQRWVVEMPQLKSLPKERTISFEKKSYSGWTVNTGVPHFVLILKEDEEIPKEIVSNLRKHQEWGSAGSNITLLKAITSHSGAAKTFERGVEDFTAACGTGAVAATLVLSKEKPGTYKIIMPGGELEVIWDGERSRLIGHALLLGEHRFFPEMWNEEGPR